MKRKLQNINAADWEAVESPSLSDELLSRMRPVRKIHPDRPNRVAGPHHTADKVLVSIGFAPEVLDYFKATGTDWQSHMETALREWITSHPLPSRETR